MKTPSKRRYRETSGKKKYTFSNENAKNITAPQPSAPKQSIEETKKKKVFLKDLREDGL